VEMWGDKVEYEVNDEITSYWIGKKYKE